MQLWAPIPKLKRLKMICASTFLSYLIIYSNDRDDDPSKAQTSDFVLFINKTLVAYIVIR